MSEQMQAEPATIDPSRIRVTADGGAHLVGGRCRECRTTTWGVKHRCPSCWATQSQEEVTLSDTGDLYSMIKVHRAPAGYRAPYWVGLLDLPESVRVFARIRWPDEAGWRIGQKMRFALEPVEFEDGRTPVLMPTFEPVPETRHA